MEDDVRAFICGVFVGIALCVFIVAFNMENHHEIVKHHGAHFDAKSGVFTWDE